MRFPISDDAQEWELDAACYGHDPSLFFGPNRFEPKRERLDREAAAKEICATCPALGPCREHALGDAEAFGVWGGLGESERRAILTERQALTKRAG